VITFHMMAPLMFGGLILFMLIGYPVAFSLAAVGLFFGWIAACNNLWFQYFPCGGVWPKKHRLAGRHHWLSYG